MSRQTLNLALGVGAVVVGYMVLKGKIHLPHKMAANQTWTAQSSAAVMGPFDFSVNPSDIAPLDVTGINFSNLYTFDK